MFQLNKQQQCRRKMLQREAAIFGYMVSYPTHTVLSANISHLNGKRLFGEKLHIGPTSLNPPIEYQSLPCFVSFSSITRSSFVPCEQKLA